MNQRQGGLKPSPEDLQWLRLMDLKTGEEIPAFNVSRLVALGYVAIKAGGAELTEKGRHALSRT